jgi:aryl-alcohol dehydrogenase-like predicted oxidoreductase
MQYRRLGRSGLQVSVLALGTMAFGGSGALAAVGSLDLAQARRQVDLALDAGVNLVDTADVYSAGRAEEFLGQVLAGRRDRVLVATKVGIGFGPEVNAGGLSRHHIIRSVEASLRRLRSDHIDLYQAHAWDGQTPLEETLEAFDSLVRTGKVRYLGVSNYSAWHLMKLLAAADRTGFIRPVCQQIHYSLVAREAENELLPLAVDQGVGVLVWSPLAGGLLSGRYRRDGSPHDGRREAGWDNPPVHDWDRLYRTVDVLVELAGARGVPPARVVLAHLLAGPAVTCLVVGARTEAQLIENLAAADLELSERELGLLDDVSRPPLAYPYWHQLRNAASRLSTADLALFVGQRSNQ